VLADPLDLPGAGGVAGEDRPFGGGADDPNLGVLLLQELADAGDRAAGADPTDERGDLAARLLPDLRAGGPVVGLGGCQGRQLGAGASRRGSRGPGGRPRRCSSRASRGGPTWG